MSGQGTYIHGTEPNEQERLAGLNRLSNRAFVEFLSVPSTAQVLEVGSGLGLLAADVASVAENVHVVGVEQALAQIAAAARHPRVRYIQGDAHHLEFADGTFDLVYARYLLEHVSDPTAVLSEMRRVTRQGGRVAACENDISLLRLDPPCAVFDGVWQAFQLYQRRLGGDSQIGRRLYRLFRDAGFSKIELSVQPEVHWYGSPAFAGWVQNLVGNIESARQGLVESGSCGQRQIDDAVAELVSLIQNGDASSCFVWNRAVASR
jgi:ubiquinone/menaquinone biosynthesis C-methylase UbiE